MPDAIAKRLSNAQNPRVFLDGSRRSVVTLDSVAIGLGEYRPGWKWSKHAGPQTGRSSAAHVGYILSGRMIVRGADGEEVTVGPGDAFEAKPGHDAWVLGNEACVALDFESLKQPDRSPEEKPG
jgi:quercetin dioxygenase-like cupin family protein